MTAESVASLPYELKNRSGGRRSEICDTALLLFEEHGYAQTSMQQLADAMGLNKATLYHYVTTKTELLFEINRVITEIAVQEIEAILAANLTATEKLTRIIEITLVRIRDYRRHVVVFFQEQAYLTGRYKQRLDVQRSRFERAVEAILDEAFASGEFRTADRLAVKLSLYGVIDTAHIWYKPEGRLGPRQMAEYLADVLLSGLLPRGDHANA